MAAHMHGLLHTSAKPVRERGSSWLGSILQWCTNCTCFQIFPDEVNKVKHGYNMSAAFRRHGSTESNVALAEQKETCAHCQACIRCLQTTWQVVDCPRTVPERCFMLHRW